MSITLTIVDNQDGTGATATITGSAGGSTNNVYFSALGSNLAWALGGTRTGDGTIDMSMTYGVYLFYLLSNTTIVPPVYGTVSNASTQAWNTQCRRAVMATVAALPIPPAANLYEQMWPNQSYINFPCILFTSDGVQETEVSELSSLDDVGYPVRLAIADRRDKQDQTMLPAYEIWRQDIANMFRNQRCPGVQGSVKCLIEEYVILDPNGRDYEHVVSGMVIRCIIRQQRGGPAVIL